MAKVYNLTLEPQVGTSALLARWSFNGNRTVISSGLVKVGSLVSINANAVYYNGSPMPSWVQKDRWYVTAVKGDRAVLGRNQSGSHNIRKPINLKYLRCNGQDVARTVHTLDHFKIIWYYYTNDGMWYTAESSDTDELYAVYDPPENATFVQITVIPVSTTYKKGDNDVSWWTGEGNSVMFSMYESVPADPADPTVKVDGNKLTITVDGIEDPYTDQIYFEVKNVAMGVTTNNGYVNVRNQSATYACTVSNGGKYRVYCYGVNIISESKNWTKHRLSNKYSLSDEIVTVPNIPNGPLKLEALSKTSIKVSWKNKYVVDHTSKYMLEYTMDRNNFDTSTGTTKTPDITNGSTYTISGLETGHEYFFRLCRGNDAGYSGWGKIYSITIGTKPSAPTTWSSTTTAIAGEPLNLYWIHNASDGSSQSSAKLRITVPASSIDAVKDIFVADGFTYAYVEDTKKHTFEKTIQNTTVEEDQDKTSVYPIDTSSFKEGLYFEWAVKTAGVTNEYGDFSAPRRVDIYSRPSLALSIMDASDNVVNVITSFPFKVSALAGPDTQIPTGYYLTITANRGYMTLDHMGNEMTVSPGDIIYSKYFDITAALSVTLSASDLDLEDGIDYTVSCLVSMNSGLTAENSTQFTVSWTDVDYYIDAEIGIEPESVTAYITPYCQNADGQLVSNALLSVYRRDFDGGYTEIATGIENDVDYESFRYTTVTDPHPALDYARYRIVAIDKSTGAVSYYDIPSYPVNEKAAIIQWDETWTNFNSIEEAAPMPSAHVGSLLKLYYNIDVSDNHSKDSELVNYIGRTYPVGYYGTHLDMTSTWSMVIPKDDEETLYALRRLAKWMGNAYVREPSGSGYWANVEVSFSQKHCDVTIPITLNITRVEGGA